MTFGDGFPDAKTLKTELKDDLLTITGENGFEMRLDVSGALTGAQTVTTIQNLTIDATGIGAMRLQIGANEHQVLEVIFRLFPCKIWELRMLMSALQKVRTMPLIA